MRAPLQARRSLTILGPLLALVQAAAVGAAVRTASPVEPVPPEVASPAEVPADLLTAPEDLLEAVRHNYYPGDHDPTAPSGALRWRVWARHFPEAASWAAAHHGTAEWAHHFPERARWALDNPGASTFVLNHPDVLEWQAAHPAAAQRARATRLAHAQRDLWDELTGRTLGGLSDAAMAAATAPEARPEVTLPAPTKHLRFEVRKPPASNVIARREPTSPAMAVSPHPNTVIVHETVVVPAYQPAPVILRTTPQLRYRFRPRIVIYRGGHHYRGGHYRYRHRGPHHGRPHRRSYGRHHGHHRPWW